MEHLTFDGAAIDDGSLILAERVETRLEHRLDRWRYLDHLTRVARERDELLEEEWVALRGCEDPQPSLRVELDTDEEAVGELGGDVGCKRLEQDGGGVQLASAPAGARVEELGSSDAEQEDRHAARPVGHMLDQVVERWLRPMEIVEHDHQRPFLREPLEERPGRELRVGR